METFRCPTCVGVLPDAYAKRCGSCGQGLHRRRSRSPRVLGDEHRLAGKQLPVDRWMLERLYGEHRRKRTTMPPVAWHGRFVPSPASAEPDVQRPPVMEPPAPNPIEPMQVVPEQVVPEQAPATVDALHLDMFVAPSSPEAPVAFEREPETLPVRPADEPEFLNFESAQAAAAAAPPVTARPIVTHEALDPEVRALVDELYEQARAEMSGLDVAREPEPEPEPAPEMRLPTGEPVIDVHLPEPPAPPAPPAPSGPSASATTSAVGEVIPQNGSSQNGSTTARSGWVPAFIAEDRHRRITD